MCSFLVSITNTALGRRSRSAMPPRLRLSFSSSRVCCSASRLGMPSKSPAACMARNSCIRFTRPDTVAKLVSMPPSQRWLTYGIPHASRELGHRALGLLLGPHEEDRAAVGHQVPDERVGGLDAAQRLAQVDEIDPVALTQDEALHLRVPPPRLVAEVHPGFQKLSHGNDGHRYVLQSVAPLAQRRRKATTVEGAQVMLVGVAAHPCGGPNYVSRSVHDPQALGWVSPYTERSRSLLTCVYTCVVARLECPSSSWTTRRSAPPSRRWVA